MIPGYPERRRNARDQDKTLLDPLRELRIYIFVQGKGAEICAGAVASDAAYNGFQSYTVSMGVSTMPSNLT